MSNLNQISKVKELYQKGSNLMEFLRVGNNGMNDPESIMISYDFQAGSYIKAAESNEAYFDEYTASIEKIINRLGDFNSVMEVGVGEATVMTPLMKKLTASGRRFHKLGFDISWSRVKYARQYSKNKDVEIDLFTGNLFNIPLPDDSVDIVYTSHSLEPNGGSEKEALKELYRVASKYVVLLEPSYEFATEEGRSRMDKHGYIKYINHHAADLGYNVIDHRLFDTFINPLNPTALTIIKKATAIACEPDLVCPITKTRLSPIKGSLFSYESLMVYPVIDGIPCLLAENAILASHFNS